MKRLIAVALLTMSGIASGQVFQWSIHDTAVSAAEESNRAYEAGGDDGMARTIQQCHASIGDRTAFNAATARCITMEVAWLMLVGRANTSVADAHPYFVEGGGTLERIMFYFTSVPQGQIDAVMLTIREAIYEVMPELRPSA